MSRDSLPASLIESLIFWTEEDLPEDFADEIIKDDDPDTGNGDDGGEDNAQSDGMEDGDAAKTSKGKGKGIDRADEKRQSMYVGLFEDMVNTVLKEESFLFTGEELDVLRSYSLLSYIARYLLVRLILRKPGQWFRLDKLKYISELGEQGIQEAIIELCTFPINNNGETQESDTPRSSSAPPPSKPTPSDAEIIDLTLDSDDEGPVAGPSCLPPPLKHSKSNPTPTPPSSQSTATPSIFAQDESHATLDEIVSCLNVDELKSIARMMKIAKPPTTRTALVEVLIASATSQSTLHKFVQSNTPNKAKHAGRDRQPEQFKQTTLNFFSKSASGKAQRGTLRQFAIQTLKKCIRVNSSLRALAHRLHIVFFRCTAHPPSILTPSLLARCRKRTYSPYVFKRTSSIFPTREALAAYEEALMMEAAIDTILEGGNGFGSYYRPGGPDLEALEKAEAVLDEWTKMHGGKRMTTSGIDERDETANKENTPALSQSRSQSQSQNNSQEQVEISRAQTEPPKESNAMLNARRVVEVFECVYPRWQQLVREKGSLDGRARGLERFDEGYILTRVVYKGTAAFGILKEHDREMSLLQELLAQTRWRRGKRGAWYDRMALILMHHKAKAARQGGVLTDVDGQESKGGKGGEEERVLREAMEVIMRGLHDEDTHIVSRQALERRLTRLEKRLKIPEDQRHICAGKLEKAEDVIVFGTRLREQKSDTIARANIPVVVQVQGPAAVYEYRALMKKWRLDEPEDKWVGKSIWVGRDKEKVTVEELALQHYEDQSFKGFHSEGRVVYTIYGLLFWDILFSNVAGAFETPFQSAPLDIATDCFYYARKELIEERLKEIAEGRAPEILARVDDEHRENATQCVGVRWKDFERQDLVDIVTCMNDEGLAMICRLCCEDYGGRGSGIPDLLVWRTDDRQCKFVEVKGPGDKLSENQKVWIDVLKQNGVGVEVCRVVEHGTDLNEKKKRKAKTKVIRVYKNAEIEPESEADEPESEAEAGPSGQPKKRRRSGEGTAGSVTYIAIDS